ncbi:MAG: site-2 protease family protein [Phycisphaeraceae bacterium]|nr:site-2 protease family protein [Phycisphaeraceae bacterium]
MSGWWVEQLWNAGRGFELGSWIFWVIFSICLHELGHGWAAIWEGDDTPRRTGHMTIDPMVHMGGYSIMAFLLLGFAWGLMPVNPGNFRHRRWGDAIVAVAGPAVNLVLGFILLTIAGVISATILTSGTESKWAVNSYLFFETGGRLNLILLALNLLPIPPLDGSRILATVSSPYRRLLNHPNAGMFGLAFFVIVFWITPIGRVAYGFIENAASVWVGIVQGVIMATSGS